MSMPDTSLMFWLIAVPWTIATAVFLSKLDKRKLAILVIILSLLVLVSLVRGRVPVRAAKPAALFVSNPHFTAPT